MGDITLDGAIALLASEKLRERSDGLADLKHILLKNRRNSKLNSLNDKACHKIFESLFRFVSVEKSQYNRSNSKGASASRLSSCASVLRIAVDVFLRNLRTKSVRAIVDHITDTLLGRGSDSLFELLSVDYAKCLVTLLRHPPHLEHLALSEWEKVMDFCLKSISAHTDQEGLTIRERHSSFLDGYLSAGGRASTPARSTPMPTVSEKPKGDTSAATEAVVCIQLLVGSPSAPIQEAAERVLHGLTKFVGSSMIAGSGHQAAFASVNTVVMKILFDQSELARSSLLDLVPAIKRFWATKFVGLKDEMLVTVMLCAVILIDANRRDPSELIARVIEELLETLYTEYTKRSEKEILQLDELMFHHSGSEQQQEYSAWPRFEGARSEPNWTTLWIIAKFLELAEELRDQSLLYPTSGEAATKRQRLASHIEDIFRDSTVSSGMRRLYALQLIPFLPRSYATTESKLSLLERLLPHIMDDNATTASWTMVAIASIACSSDASSQSLRHCWQRAWEMASHVSLSQATARAACHLLNIILQRNLLDYQIVAQATSSMLTSINTNGPSTISDSSLAFWATLLRITSQINPGLVPDASNKICSWLRETWGTGSLADRLQIAQVAMFARPLDLLNMLFACANRPFTLPKARYIGPVGLIARGWHFYLKNKRLLNYIFDLQGSLDLAEYWEPQETLSLEKFPRQDSSDNIALDLLQTKVEGLLQTWEALSEDKTHHITVDLVQIVTSSCVTIALYMACLPQQPANRVSVIQQNNQSLWEKLCSFLASREPAFIHACLMTLTPLLVPNALLPRSSPALIDALSSLVPSLANLLESYREKQKEVLLLSSEEAMDLDDPILTTYDQSTELVHIFSRNRETSHVLQDIAILQRSITIYLSIFQRIHASSVSSEHPFHDDLIEYLTGFDEVDILSAQIFLPHVYRACVCDGVERHSLLRILEDLGEKCLQSYEMERCESSHVLCLRMMGSFVEMWTGSEDDDFHASATDIYSWFTEVLLAKKLASTSVLIEFTQLLSDLLSHNVTYSSGSSSPSPRTSLFTIIREGDAVAKFYAGELIPSLFGQFSLTEHDLILDDVLDSLPRDSDWDEGIALRLVILARLASRWHTLLRRSIYHMFETAAKVPNSLRYAENCLRDVAETLGLEDAKQLFRLFSSQIIYTWTEEQSVMRMPFSIFGYKSLKEMLIDVQDEIIGQVMMRANETEGAKLSACTNVPFDHLVVDSFCKAEAYSIARDISTPPEQGSQPRGVENRMKKLLGTDKFVSLIESHFPQMIAIFFGTLDQYEQIERAFLKREGFEDPHAVLRRISEKSTSGIILPANQQPSFRARYLLDELEFLCKRSGYDLGTIWTPTLATYVCRTLLESIHPALGSLHACSVIRKIRILVSIAGSVMLSDYPFDMVIHALRPYLVDIFCAEDTLGIFWYLLEAGKAYLCESPGLMAGIAVTTLLSLRRFLVAPPTETAQPGLVETVVAKIKLFLDWFGSYLKTYEPVGLKPEKDELFRRLVASSQGINPANEGSEGSKEEHDLLLEVLRDQNSRTSLLSGPIADHVISLLCTESKQSPETHLNVSGDDQVVMSHAVAICQTLQKFDPGTEYKLWAARVIGRAFATTGKISDILLREQDPKLFAVQSSQSLPSPFHRSKASILMALCGMLQNSSHLEVGLVERTIQLIVSNLGSTPEFEPCGRIVPSTLLKAFTWSPYQCPEMPMPTSVAESRTALIWDPDVPVGRFARSVGLFLSDSASKDPVIGPLRTILCVIPDLAVQILPYILHDVLLAEDDGKVNIRKTISEIFGQVLRQVNDQTIPHARLVINCILYLRNQPRPEESTIVERDEWLDVDYAEASSAANKCRLPKTGLLFLEISASRIASTSRRSSVAKFEAAPEILHEIFRKIDDPDVFYGIQQDSSLEAVMDRLEHESSGFKNLLFQSAHYDSELQMGESANVHGVLKALNSTNLQGIANSVFTISGSSRDTSGSFESMLQTAKDLRRWDIPVSPLSPSPSASVFRAFQSLNISGTLNDVFASIDECLLSSLDLLTSTSRSATSLRTAMRTLGVMTEVCDVLSSASTEDVSSQWQTMVDRDSWLKTTSVSDVGEILTCHEALFSSIKNKDFLKTAINISDRDAQLLEVKVIRQSLKVARDHGISQASLKSAVCLSKLAHKCSTLGINIEGAAKFDLANVLWDQGEMAASIQILQQLRERNDLHKQAIPISRAELLVTLGHHVAEARLEKPDTIVQDYLSAAVKELKTRSLGEDVGRVYHGFAMFCDRQLQNPDGLEDFRRIEQLRDRKEREVHALEDMMKSAHGKEKEALKYHRAKTKQWFDLDDREYQRLRRSREAFLQQCLENYLLCLKESESFNNDALRFCALWLDKSASTIGNMAVSKYISQVPSRKFAPLMNQLTSRLLDVSDEFQKMLFALIFRICVEHPYHGMYQIFASSKSKGGKDQSALSRNRAAGKLVDCLKNDKRMGPTWVAVHNANISYVRFAVEKPNDKYRSGAKVPLKKLSTGERLEQDAATQRLPPPTMKIDIRVDCDYSDVPKLVKYNPEFTIASGVSAPKIVTAIASNGSRYKQLFKGGNDDLRQDAIMEQVFEQVSSLLKDHQVTRQRNLGIRTYKVLPLTSNAGIIEFVPHTIPLHDFLMPAHQRYFPKDMKPNVARKHIADVQTRSFEQRVRTYRQVTEHFHPVMRFFFMENFNNPDDWFSKRLAYTRSTAAISILGHVLGLGDRHGHNILLDERTGEVVHIDLGVAFEQGRVLPVPEVVPFRLTRDLVDGMGISKTEGVFRRCCEFTLEALREESYSIMTILDVLRYDPLYSWTVSPLRMKRMQDAQEADGGPPVIPGANNDQQSTNEPSEADRALTVVAKKLSKTLSVTATVNELIQQATDDKNLAVLYCGWAAYA
ncbi:DNA-binding protein kinase TEL1 [Aspergillus tubingensis]|uniref:Serine/threonine-protein kinase Tel1 n=1 Tax=Aspergillus niger TaxID=5061 RepID=A0A100IKV0_ASPNG|nr:ataxia telangiectasia mutated [Aspergillus tubingensis]GAQ42611.1 ataxia telangiectasia mutated [Aspergillus niger]GFN11336.1 ataxia telangiectasia mutated [Aspergillus tubingensis]